MNTLRQAVQEYLKLRRSLGYKLSWAGKLLPAFVTFMEKHHASYITTRLALAWAQQPSTVQPRVRAQRLSVVRLFAERSPDQRQQRLYKCRAGSIKNIKGHSFGFRAVAFDRLQVLYPDLL